MSARPILLRISSADELRNVLARVIARRQADRRPVGKDLLDQFTAADLEHRRLCQQLGDQLGVRHVDPPTREETPMISNVNSI